MNKLQTNKTMCCKQALPKVVEILSTDLRYSICPDIAFFTGKTSATLVHTECNFQCKNQVTYLVFNW